MTENDKLRMKLRYAENFEAFIDRLCLTDRQKKIAKLKYLRGWANVDIAAELDVSRRTITSDMEVIRKIVGSTDPEELRIDNFSKM